ncbi:hypothetical protein BJY04DRAFT_190538 [Aspergillus karnatakaensis]|uniref:uncharacterized protein n=1 Tax=Aspergillus karnatakaensis TaxID=1810916 RepID=UPI003CCD4DB8
MALLNAGNGAEGFILHVLCPSLPQPNRFTFKDLSLSITVADLKARISQSIPSHPSPDTQRLLYLGKLLTNDNVTLQSLFEPSANTEFSMHLVLPPAPPSQSASTVKPTEAPSSSARDQRQQETGGTHRRHGYRAPNPLSPTEIAQSLQENARRRLAEIHGLQQRGGITQPRNPEWSRPSIWTPPQQFPLPPSYVPGTTGPATPTTVPFAASSSLSFLDSMETFQLPEEVRPRLRLIKQYISLAEEQLNCGIVPTIEHVGQLRTHLFKLLDDQLRRPMTERGEYIEPLISRVFSISSRADQLRQPHLLPVQTGSPHGAMAPLYLVSSPDGYQAVCTPSVAADAARALGSPRTPGPPPSVGGQQENAQPNADAAVMENVVRQAVLNQRPVAEGQFGLGRNVRRLWLFIRLYFFCHMFSQPGTQTRTIYLVLAVLAAVLSETSIPRRIYEMIFVPIQHHLEGLVHFTPEEQAPPPGQGAAAAANVAVANQVATQAGGEAGWGTGLRGNLRRVERSAALFLASLVPGVGERHIEVRNAAEAARNALLARQEEERRQQEEAAATAEHPPGETDDTEQSTHANTDSETFHETRPTIPQEAH